MNGKVPTEIKLSWLTKSQFLPKKNENTITDGRNEFHKKLSSGFAFWEGFCIKPEQLMLGFQWKYYWKRNNLKIYINLPHLALYVSYKILLLYILHVKKSLYIYVYIHIKAKSTSVALEKNQNTTQSMSRHTESYAVMRSVCFMCALV